MRRDANGPEPTLTDNPKRVAILDDYQGAALGLADWSALDGLASLTVFRDTLPDPDALVARLHPFDVLCVMRERTPLPREILERLPNLKFIASTGLTNRSIDQEAVARLGIEIANTRYRSTAAIELTWALILSSARRIPQEAASLRSGGWQVSIGDGLAGRTLGVVGLGNIGHQVAQIGAAFEMDVIAWSENLTEERAAEVGAKRVSKTELFRDADVVTVHLVLSNRTRGLVGAAELLLMKPSAWLVNTSRGPIVDENALIDALKRGAIAGAALDVFDREPLPADSAFRAFPNVLATPHIGYVTHDLYATFYQDCVDNIADWIRRSAGP